MTCISLDLTIDTALRDPVIAAAMRADRVDPRRFESLLRATARRLEDLGGAGAATVGTLAGRIRRAAHEDATAW